MQQASEEFIENLDSALRVIFSVYQMEGCKETLEQLCEMPLDLFLDLRDYLMMVNSYKEESTWNQLRRNGQL